MQHRDELQLVWESVSPTFPTKNRSKPENAATLERVCSGMSELQKHIFENWLEHGSGRSLEEMILEGWLNFPPRPYVYSAIWDVSTEGADARMASAWTTGEEKFVRTEIW
jgi:hypothetical protein